MKPNYIRCVAIGLALACLFSPVYAREDATRAQGLYVTATAYNSVVEQTDGDPMVAAWGDRLQPGTRAIAVSRDLLDKGLRRNAKVRIHGLPGEYVVLDKMHHRWEKRIDIYMGEDVKAARRFGRRQVQIYWSGM